MRNPLFGPHRRGRSGRRTDGLGWLDIVRLGLVQAALGAIVVLTNSTLNRVLIVELGLAAVAMRSPRQARPMKVRGRAPTARPRRAISAKPRVRNAARPLSPMLSASPMPTPIATMFFKAPPSSTPTMSSLV